MIRSFLQMSALIITLGASVFLLKSNLGFTPETISKLSSTYFGYNKEVVKTFAQQSADTRVGFILLIIAFVLQMVNALWPMRIKDFGIDWYGILISIGFCIIVLTFAQRCSQSLSEKHFKDTVSIVEKSLEPAK